MYIRIFFHSQRMADPKCLTTIDSNPATSGARFRYESIVRPNQISQNMKCVKNKQSQLDEDTNEEGGMVHHG